MIKEAFGIADTVDEAKEAAILELNAKVEDDVMFDIIDLPKKKVLGIFGGTPAKVRAYIEIDEPATSKVQKKNNKQKDKKADKPKQKKAEESTEKAEIPAEAVDVESLPADSPAVSAVNYVKTVLMGLGCTDIDIKVVLKDNGAMLILSGEGLGVVIGHRGETLDALQYLTSLAANNGNGYYKVSIDIGNYRERREKTLISLAKRISAQAIRSGRSRSLEPMNPYERRIIHTAVQEIEGVSSHSVGEGDRRHIIITPDNASAKNVKKNSVNGEVTAREPKKDSEALPLYGKIK